MRYWKKAAGQAFEYIAVLRMVRVDIEKEAYGQQHYKQFLADGTSEHGTFEREVWQQWQKRVESAGIVVNP